MDGAGRSRRSRRSSEPKTDLKAAAIGAVVLLREYFGFDRKRVKARVDREQPNRAILWLERYMPRRAALKLTIDNWRWAGVPFYLRTGKALGVKRTEIAIKFKQAPFAMFRDTPVDRLSQNYLIISTEPTEGIALQFNTKVPGPNINIDGVEMKFRYKDYFKAEPSTGYETLIYDCMIGDNILFQRADSVEAGWQAVQPFLDAWKKAGGKGLKVYEPGSEGPEEANDLLERDGRSWRKLG